MLMVIPRATSSGARSMPSNDTYRLTDGFCAVSTFVMAAVSVVLPWSTCPIVPMFRCGLVRTNWLLAIVVSVLNEGLKRRARAGRHSRSEGDRARTENRHPPPPVLLRTGEGSAIQPGQRRA